MKGWKYDLGGTFLLDPIRPVVAGTTGMLWILALDGECYGVEAYVMMAEDAYHRMTIQTVIPLNDFVGYSVTRWMLIDSEGRVLRYGP